MKKLIMAALAVLSLASCSPQYYTMYLQKRVPSESGVNMDGKTVAVVYLEDGSTVDSLFNNCVADGLASGIEKEYFDGEQSVDVYSIISTEDYSSKDSLVRLVLDMDVDMVMLIDRPQFSAEKQQGGRVLSTSRLYVFDSMDKADIVRPLTASFYASTSTAPDSTLPKDAQKIGSAFSKKFINGWKEEGYSLVYFDNGKWIDALDKMENLDWASASRIWMDIARSRMDPYKRSFACYNLAVVCFIREEYSLALDWLDQAKTMNPEISSSNFRKLIQDSMK